MGTLRIASKAEQASTFPVLLVAHLVNQETSQKSIHVDFEDAEKLDGTNHVVEHNTETSGKAIGSEEVLKTLLSKLQPKSPEQQIREWFTRARNFQASDPKKVEEQLLELDSHLTLRSYVVGYVLSPADVALWGAIRGNRIAYASVKKGALVNFIRWHNFIEETCPWIGAAIRSANAISQAKKAARSAEGGSYDIGLPDTEKGVVTRFPPEPSGYLHIGHAKAALLNDYFAHERYKGTMICRFDDTNPSKEKAEFQDSILEDLNLMGIHPDRVSYTSDYFEQLLEYCITLIKSGKAYCDDTDKETMRLERGEGIPSRRRDCSVEENLERFDLMKNATPDAQKWCVRAKISVDDSNKCMRDPVIYRSNPESHHRTGAKYKIYPTYDFACPIVDSLEGITHALRTIEYRDRNPQYNWMLKSLALRSVHIWDFARMNMIRTVLSKRKLTKLVDSGVVWGWNDPRFPTVRGVRRRGMTIPALREFILKQGPSRNVVNLDWTTFWATNKKYIDPIVPRHTAISTDHRVPVTVLGARAAPYSEEKPKHGKNPELGNKKVAYSSKIIIEQADAQNFAQDEEITLMSWGNAIVRKITHSLNPLHRKVVTGLELELHLQGDFKTTKQKVTWLSEEGQQLVPVELVDFDYLLTKDSLEEHDALEDFINPNTEFRSQALADENVASLRENDIVQFERKGYYRLDRPFAHAQSAVFFNIPTGKAGK